MGKTRRFNDELASRFGVLGGADNGFWSKLWGPDTHQDDGRDVNTLRTGMLANNADQDALTGAFKHLDGHDLLHHKSHLTDEEGWKLAFAFFQYHNIAKLSKDRRPTLATEFEGGVEEGILGTGGASCRRGLQRHCS